MQQVGRTVAIAEYGPAKAFEEFLHAHQPADGPVLGTFCGSDSTRAVFAQSVYFQAMLDVEATSRVFSHFSV